MRWPRSAEVDAVLAGFVIGTVAALLFAYILSGAHP